MKVFYPENIMTHVIVNKNLPDVHEASSGRWGGGRGCSHGGSVRS